MDERSVFHRRFSCRSYRPDPISREVLTELLEAARWAPNAGNLEPWRFVVVSDQLHRSALARAAYGQTFIAAAPVVVVVCAVPEESARFYGPRGRELYCLQDTAAAVENLLLAATEADLGTCWVGAFSEAAVARDLELAPGWRPIALVTVGYPAEEPARRRRRPLESITRWID
jgi:nitroreductase